MDFFYGVWVEYWFDAPTHDGGFWGDEPDYVLHGPQLPYSYREFALDGAPSGVVQEPAPWVPAWQQLTHVSGALYRDSDGSYWTDWSDEDGPCWTEQDFGPESPPSQGPKVPCDFLDRTDLVFDCSSGQVVVSRRVPA